MQNRIREPATATVSVSKTPWWMAHESPFDMSATKRCVPGFEEELRAFPSPSRPSSSCAILKLFLRGGSRDPRVNLGTVKSRLIACRAHLKAGWLDC